MTDIDNDEEPESRNKVTLMTVHSAKGLEYKYVYIVGCEENLFPSQRAMETIEGLEEERRLFYVALTRAKKAATLSCAEMRFKWGNMEFSSPSRFLSEIDEQFVDSDFDIKSSRARRNDTDNDGESAIDRLRRQYDVRFQQKSQAGARPAQQAGNRFGGASQGNRFGNGVSQGSRFGGGFGGNRPSQPQPAPQPSRPTVNIESMRRIDTSAAPATAGNASACGYAVGDVVEHVKFGRGRITEIVPLASDHKLVVDFGAAGSKTLIARLAKLRKL